MEQHHSSIWADENGEQVSFSIFFRHMKMTSSIISRPLQCLVFNIVGNDQLIVKHLLF